MAMSESRKRKFRRWATNGVPKSAPISEKRAFGAFVTNRRKRLAKRLGAFSVGKPQKYETKKTRGKWVELKIDRPLGYIESESFLNHVAAFADSFRRSHRGTVAFLRLKILASENPYSPFPFNVDGDMAEHWFGSKGFKDKTGAYTSIAEIAEKLIVEVLPYDNGSGRIVAIHVFTVRNKRGVKPSRNPS